MSYTACLNCDNTYIQHLRNDDIFSCGHCGLMTQEDEGLYYSLISGVDWEKTPDGCLLIFKSVEEL